MIIKIYTDGACSGNPGPGGWAAVILIGALKKELFGGEKSTTNNRMELTAAIKALEYCSTSKDNNLLNSDTKIFTDSVYVKKGITEWIKIWEENDWKTADKKIVKNIDLWKKLRKLTESKKIFWYWVKGHSGQPMNELADALAKQATPFN